MPVKRFLTYITSFLAGFLLPYAIAWIEGKDIFVRGEGYGLLFFGALVVGGTGVSIVKILEET